MTRNLNPYEPPKASDEGHYKPPWGKEKFDWRKAIIIAVLTVLATPFLLLLGVMVGGFVDAIILPLLDFISGGALSRSFQR